MTSKLYLLLIKYTELIYKIIHTLSFLIISTTFNILIFVEILELYVN